MKRSTMVNNNKLRPPRKRKSDASLIDRSIGEGKKRDDVDRIGKSNEPIAFCFVAVVLASLSLSLSLLLSLSPYIFVHSRGWRPQSIDFTYRSRTPSRFRSPTEIISDRHRNRNVRHLSLFPSEIRLANKEQEEEKQRKKGRIIRKKRTHVQHT